MAIIGTFGDLVFEVSRDKVHTFDNLNRTTEARYTKHAIKHQKPIMEFDGPEVDPITFDMVLRADLGVNPIKELDKWRDYVRKGKRAVLIIGNRPFSNNAFVITKINETYKNIDNRGNVLSIEATVDMMEYPITIKTTKKTTQNTAKKATASNSSNTAKKKSGTITITVQSVNIRNGPGTSYKILGIASKNNTLTVYEKKGDWYHLGSGKYITASTKYSTFKGVS
ncbi:phage tail protein [Lysinibacillus fusiformis]|uniref:phage tail protein n=1 Tax=Lysinibacillus fusiformis TaxID=28031 RepID=UPI001E2A63C2|nr:phage tail protein [Lysinibacillus fusiformis]MCE4044551.1 phage tail protein [Lysinibacillus fusiformis]